MARGLAWGDIRLVEFGSPDKTRPALVLTRTGAIVYLNAVTVAPISRTMRGAPTELPLGVEHGLKAASAANFDAMQTVRKERIGKYLGSVSAELKAAIRDAVDLALGLD